MKSRQFIWKKKIERDVSLGVNIVADMKSRTTERKAELEKLRKRRALEKAFKVLRDERARELARARARACICDEEAADPETEKEEENRAMALAVVKEQQRRLQEALASKTAASSEDSFAINELNLDSQVYWWHDKYRPRKPKYVNHVHTGYVWNKYNRTHYDHENPPPKFVQGYKFDIFYPDLVDKTKVPSFILEEDKDSESNNGESETCIIRFHAGPPYQDIAFRIVNKDWEYSHKNGFKCTFDGGILRLYFNFKRCPYRR
nr:cactin-like [Quercus suber]POE77311.1 isoform 2 of cactin [Quercus suber]